jgi:arabinofuranosyltransferase
MKAPRSIAAFGLLVFLVILFRTAWVSDDALISLRTVLNVTHGYGLTFNVVERVQTFTHPLWVMLLIPLYLLLRNIYTALFVLSFAVSLAAFWYAVRSARSSLQACLVAGLLVFSHAFVDFSTSGLENPLSCLLLVALVALAVREDLAPRRRLAGLWLVAALLYLTRPDDVLLALPVVLVASWRLRHVGAVVGAALIGLLPAIAWTVFAVIYYGFPFPNTAYAKLGMGIDRGALWTQGLLYFVDSIDRDPLTLAVVATGLGLALLWRSTPARALAGGLVLYLVYIVTIGGDFMAGRFFSSPFFLATLIVGRAAVGSRQFWRAAPVALGAIALSSWPLPILSDSRFQAANIKPNGLADERAIYFQRQSLVRADRSTFAEPEYPARNGWPPPPNVMEACGLVGDTGVNWGPNTYVLDSCALADPLLSRLPALWNTSWRIGHFRRMYPAGYEKSVETNSNRLEDPSLKIFYDKIRLITRGPLFSGERWRAIVGMNLGWFDELINKPFYRYGGEITRLEDLAQVVPDGTPDNAASVHPIAVALAVTCEDTPGRRHLDLSVPSDDAYRLDFVKRNAVVSTLDFGPIPDYRRKPGLTSYTLDVPDRAVRQGFDTIVVVWVKGGSTHGVGHLILEGYAPTDPELRHRVALRDGLVAR